MIYNSFCRKKVIYLVENVKHTSMKKILGLDLGTNSTGWALVNEAENTAENRLLRS